MSSYEPFFICDFRVGKQLNKEPFLIPADAYTEIQNAYLYQGVLQKRLGYSEFATTGSGLPIIGIYNYYTNAGTQELLCMDTNTLYRYDPTISGSTKFVTISGGSGKNIWDGTESAYIHAMNFQDHLYMTNNLDLVQDYNGTTVSGLDVIITPGGSNEVYSCLMVFPYKQRLVLLNTSEASDGSCRQRARWCKPKQPNDWTNDGYVDAPTVEWIVSAEFLGDDLIVFFERSVWKLFYTGNADLPFSWEKIVDGEGSYAPMSVSIFSDELVALGPTNVIATDGRDAYRIDAKIPDFALEFNPEKIDWAYAATLDEVKQVWMTYPSLSSEYCDKVLVLNYVDNSWFTFTIPITSFGFYKHSEDLRWCDIDQTWDEIESSWDDRTTTAGYPITLAGTRDGTIYRLNDTNADNGSAIEVIIQTGRFNPYKEQGLTCRLGWIDFLVTVDPDVSVDVELYKNFEDTAYATKTLTCSGIDLDKDKEWKRIYVNCVADTHKIRLYQNMTGGIFEIHAIVPFAKPGGRLY